MSRQYLDLLPKKDLNPYLIDGTLPSLILTGISHNGAATSMATGTITYTYATTTASTTLYQQLLTLPSISATTTYNPTTNTTLVESNDHGALYEHTWTGSKVLRFRTKDGEVGWVFGS